MSYYLSNGSNTIVHFENGLPPDYNGPLLPGSKYLHAIRDTCRLIIQEITTEFYTLRFSIYNFYETVALNSTSNKAGIHSRTLLKGNLRHNIEGEETINLKEGEFTMLWSESANCSCRFEKNKEYKTLDIFYSSGLLKQLMSFFPDLSQTMIKEETSNLLKSPCSITIPMRDIIRQIMECPFDENTRQFYFDLKVREFLYVMLESTFRKEDSSYRFTAYDTASIMKAKELLLENISKKPLSIRQLSKAVAINEFKLKAGFRQFFGSGIFECLHTARMEKARHLLLTTNKPIKEICVLTGYPRMTNFITAFRRKFGYTPGSLRRK